MARNEKMIQTVVHAGQQPTEEQIREIEAAMAMPVVPDEGAPSCFGQHPGKGKSNGERLYRLS